MFRTKYLQFLELSSEALSEETECVNSQSLSESKLNDIFVACNFSPSRLYF